MNSYNHITIEEHCCIREYCNLGKSFREIANKRLVFRYFTWRNAYKLEK